jgi:hypothetical protein
MTNHKATRPYFVTPVETGFSAERFTGIRHNLQTHPLFQLDALEALANRLMPMGLCRFVKPGMTEKSKFDHDSNTHDGRTLAEVFREMQAPGSWIALYNVERDPLYRDLVWEVMSYAGPVLAGQQKVYDVQGFAFISAPPSVTPFHIDRENNFWLNLHGRKKLYLWDHRDRETVALSDVQEFIMNGSLRNVRLKDEMMGRATLFDCGPGEGAYFPSTTPHMTRSEPEWATPGDGVAISIGIVFYTDRTRRDAWVHACNAGLEKLGFAPRPPGESTLKDRLKVPLGKVVVQALKLLRGQKPTASFVQTR